MRAAKVDRNQTEIVQALRDYGAFVVSLATVGKGVPDLLVGFKRHTILMEIKFGNNKLTEDQIVFHGKWTGGILAVVSDIESALRVLKLVENL
jgi:Holliday junction resolvase